MITAAEETDIYQEMRVKNHQKGSKTNAQTLTVRPADVCVHVYMYECGELQ